MGAALAVALASMLVLAIPDGAVAQSLSSGARGDLRTQRPLTVREVVEFESLALRSPVRLSRDGRRVAYTVAGAQRPLGSVLELIGDAGAAARLRVAELDSGEIEELTPGATSWGPAWSPDASTLAFYSIRGGEPHLWLWSPETGLRRATDAPVWPAFMDQVPRWADRHTVVVKLLPEGRSVARTARRAVPQPPEAPGGDGASVEVIRATDPRGGAEPLGEWTGWAYGGDLAAVDVRSGEVTRLATGFLPMWWDLSPDGSTLAFSAIAGVEDERAGFTLHTVPVAGGPVTTLPGRLVRPFGDGVSWSPSGDRLAYVDGSGVYVVDAGGRERTRIADPRPGWQQAAGPVWARDGESLLLADGRLWRVPIEGDAPEVVVGLDGRTIHAVVDGGERVPAETTEGEWLIRLSHETTGKTGFARVDPGSGDRLAERLRPGRMSMEMRLSATPDAGRVVVSHASATRAPELWLLGSDLAPARQLSRLNPAFDSVALGETRPVAWTTLAGDSAYGTVTLPPNFREGRPVPLVVEVYGGSRVGASPHAFDRYRQLLATRGYAVFVPGIPLQTGTPMRGHADAILPGLDALVEDGIADPDRLGAFGHSYGGYGTLSLLVQTERFGAAVASAAQGNLVGAFGQLASDGTARTRWAERGQGRMGTTPWGDPQRYVENSPVFFLDRVTTPLLLVHGTEDRTVPPYLAGEIFVGLRHLGRTVSLVRYRGEGHSWRAWRMPNKIDYWRRVVGWFDQHLRPEG